MTVIHTVTGPLDPKQLGFTQSHEHLLLRKGASYQVSSVLWQDEPEKSLGELTDYAGAGGRAVVDAQPVGCGRMAGALKEISEKSGVAIVSSTGFHKLCFYHPQHWIHSASEDFLTRLFVRELTEGMYEDGDDALPTLQAECTAGQIKTALDLEGLTPRYQRLFSAAANAAKQTQAPVMIHIENGADPMPVLSFFLERNLPASQLIFCHLDRAVEDLCVHAAIAEAGAYLEYDTIGRFKYHSDEEEVSIIQSLLSGGAQERLLLSLDTTRARLKHYGGALGLTYLLEQFLPLLQAAGVSKQQMDQMTIHNPARAFAWPLQ